MQPGCSPGGIADDVRILARAGYSVRAISDITELPQAAVRRILRREALTSLHARKWSSVDVESQVGGYTGTDWELEMSRGRQFRGGYPFEIRPCDYYSSGSPHGPVRIYRPNENGEMVLVETVEVSVG